MSSVPVAAREPQRPYGLRPTPAGETFLFGATETMSRTELERLQEVRIRAMVERVFPSRSTDPQPLGGCRHHRTGHQIGVRFRGKSTLHVQGYAP